MPVLIGTEGDDTIVGSDNDTIDALGGNDLIRIVYGVSTVNAGEGNDTIVISGIYRPGVGGSINGGAGFDTLDASALVAQMQPGGATHNYRWVLDGQTNEINFVLINASRNNFQATLATTFTQSIERIIGCGSPNRVDLQQLNRSIEFFGGASDDSINTGSGHDFLFGGAGNDFLRGGDGNDTLNGGDGNDRIFGEGGDDVIIASSGADDVDGGAGIDTYVTGNADTGIDLTVGSSSSGARLVNIENISGGDGNDFFTGDFRANRLEGGRGADTLYGLDGDDLLFGGEGGDFLAGGRGADSLSGGTGDDVLDGGAGDDVLDGGAGADTAVFSGSRSASTISFQNGSIVVSGDDGTDTLTSVEALRFSDGTYDIINGIVAAQARQTLVGSGGNDRLTGGDSNDIISGRAGDDVIIGGFGDDSLYGEDGADVIYGGDGNDGVDGGDGDDTLYGEAGNDVLAGYAGNDRLYGGDGADGLDGGTGDDTLDGGAANDFLSGGAGNDTLDGGVGNDVLNGGAGFDTAIFNQSRAQATISYANGSIVVTTVSGADNLTNIESLQFSDGIYDVTNGIVATLARQTVVGTAAADTLTGGDSNDTLRGLDGNDFLRGGIGSDTLDGGAGFDAALYAGVRRQYVASSTSVSGGPEGGTDTLNSIEEAQFVDGVLTFDASSASAQIMRLYSTTLNRAPDQAGLEANVGGLARVGLQAMADTFVASAEFQGRFGALLNQSFVEQLYVFALGRNGDAGGIAGWVGALNGGATRGQVVLGFSESLEHQNRTAPTLNAGLWVPDAQAQVIARMYDATFDRLPDVGGLASWTAALKSGTPLINIATAFAGSAEFQARYGAVSNEQFVRQMYQFCLNRQPDAGGLAGWVAALNTGTSRAQMLLNFSESAEHIGLTAASWLGGIRFDGFVGAPTLDDAIKGIDDAQVLPGIDGPDLTVVDKAHGPQVLPGGLDHDGTYDPADFGLASLFDKAHDAFVLPATPDGDFQPWIPAVGDDTGPNDIALDLFKALDATPAHDEAQFHPDIALTLPADPNTDDLSFGFHKGGHDLMWA